GAVHDSADKPAPVALCSEAAVGPAQEVVVLELDARRAAKVGVHVPDDVAAEAVVGIAAREAGREDEAGHVPRFERLLLDLAEAPVEQHVLPARTALDAAPDGRSTLAREPPEVGVEPLGLRGEARRRRVEGDLVARGVDGERAAGP